MKSSSTFMRLAALALLIVLMFPAYKLYEWYKYSRPDVYGPVVASGPADARVIALTYDDGPNPPYTDGILNVLEQEHVHATFFVVGRAAQAYQTDLRRELRDGDAIGNHTWKHERLTSVSAADEVRSLRRTDAAVFAATHHHTNLMRPPFGARNWSVEQTARSLGYKVVMWNVGTAQDWEYPSAHVIASRVLNVVKNGAIVVLHDGNGGLLCAASHLPRKTCDRSQDIAATREIVRNLKAQGYRFVTIPDLIALNERKSR